MKQRWIFCRYNTHSYGYNIKSVDNSTRLSGLSNKILVYLVFPLRAWTFTAFLLEIFEHQAELDNLIVVLEHQFKLLTESNICLSLLAAFSRNIILSFLVALEVPFSAA